MMSIELINESAWPDILKLQAEVYQFVEPESLAVLKDKWLRTPTCCFLYREDKQLRGYLLAHSWNSEQPPKLFQTLPEKTHGERLFLHDLAVSSSLSGQGVGSKMLKYLIDVATNLGFTEIRLVAVQGSKLFWQKQGFKLLTQKVCSSYGSGAQLMCRDLSLHRY